MSKKIISWNPNRKMYRCVYCKKLYDSKNLLLQHDKRCPLKYVVKAKWEREIKLSLTAC